MVLPSKEEYQRLSHESGSESHEFSYSPPPTRFWRRSAFLVTILTTLLVSIALTSILAWKAIHLRGEIHSLGAQIQELNHHVHMTRSPYANLLHTLPSQIYEPTDYSSDNETLANAAWESIDFNSGTIALSDTYAASKNLPVTQCFPWDKSKGMYLLEGYHHLHCFKQIHRAMTQYRLGLPQTRGPQHISHCLDALRRQVLCSADDTPRSTLIGVHPDQGVKQQRMCRDWSELESWAKERTACFKYPGPEEYEGTKEIEKYRFCPEGSGYEEAVRKFFEGEVAES